jgi:hypothetical protein
VDVTCTVGVSISYMGMFVMPEAGGLGGNSMVDEAREEEDEGGKGCMYVRITNV